MSLWDIETPIEFVLLICSDNLLSYLVTLTCYVYATFVCFNVN